MDRVCGRAWNIRLSGLDLDLMRSGRSALRQFDAQNPVLDYRRDAISVDGLPKSEGPFVVAGGILSPEGGTALRFANRTPAAHGQNISMHLDFDPICHDSGHVGDKDDGGFVFMDIAPRRDAAVRRRRRAV